MSEAIQQEEPKRGGARANSGRKSKFGEKSKVLQLRVPESKYDDIKKAMAILMTENRLQLFLHQYENSAL